MGCGRPAAPEWVRLGPRFAAQARNAPTPASQPGTATAFARTRTEGGWWVQVPITAADWKPLGLRDLYSTSTRIGTGYGLPPGGGPAYRFTLASEPVPMIDVSAISLGPADAAGPEGAGEASPEDTARSLEGWSGIGFAALNDALFYRGLPGEPPSADGLLEVFVPSGAPAGAGPRGSEPSWRASTSVCTGDGWQLWEGVPIELTLDTPKDAALSTWFALHSAEDEPAAAELRIELDGELLLAVELKSEGGLTVEWVRALLPPDARAGATLRFSLRPSSESNGRMTNPGVAAVLDPLLGPAEIGHPDARPWERGDRRDVIVFLADTFRADLLATYGGTGQLAPEIDALAARSLVFEKAWSPSTWTLPSHASIFSGLYPHEHGATSGELTLPESIITLAEQFQSRGYRTAAVTDGLFVSHAHALDQGFGIFDENHDDVASTLARTRAVIDADDGRPLLLFVQSYAVHSPFGLKSDHPEFNQLMRGVQDAAREHGASSEEAHAPMARLHELYRAGVPRLDATVGTIVRDLLERALLPSGVFLFTSDHGEAFGEHDHFSHGTCIYEEVIHVPLFAYGDGIAPQRRSDPVSLVQLTATLAELGRLPMHPGWSGPSFLHASDGPAYAFGCYNAKRGADQIAVRVGDQKIVLPGDDPAVAAPDPTQAFDLALDPQESSNQASAPWAGSILETHRASLRELMTPKHASGRAAIDAEALQRLGDMGYAGDDSEPK